MVGPIPANEGTILEDPGAGISTYESDPVEIQPGVFASHFVSLQAKNPDDDSFGFRALSVRKIENTTGVPVEIQFIENIPKTFAEHVDQLNYKVMINAPSDLDVDDFREDSESFVSINELVEQGFATVIEEDPILHIVIGGGILVGTAFIFFERPDLVGLTPRTRPFDLAVANDDKRAAFVNEQLLDRYCDAVVASARINTIPPRLLANVVLNEIADYGFEDTLQEIAYTGWGRSHGQVQLQPRRILEHGLIDIGPYHTLRNASVDIHDADLEIDVPGEPGEPTIRMTMPPGPAIYQRLLDPEAGIELAAREISYLLKLLAPGKPALNNPWVQSLLIDPSQGIDRNNFYSNLKVAVDTSDPVERQIQLERSLAVLIIAAYNGAGAIFNVADANQVFTDSERSTGVLSPWTTPNDIDDKVVDMDGNERFRYTLRDPRIHAENGGTIFPALLNRASCLRVVESGCDNVSNSFFDRTIRACDIPEPEPEPEPEVQPSGSYVLDRIEIPVPFYSTGGTVECDTSISDGTRIYDCLSTSQSGTEQLNLQIVHDFRLFSDEGEYFVPGEKIYIDVEATINGYSFCCSIGNAIFARFGNSSGDFDLERRSGAGFFTNLGNGDLPATGVSTLFATERQGSANLSATISDVVPDDSAEELQIVLRGQNGASVLTYHLRRIP